MSDAAIIKCDGGSSRSDLSGLHIGGGFRDYSGGGNSGRRSPEEEEFIRQFLEKNKALFNTQKDGGSPSSPNFGGGYPGMHSRSGSTSSGGSPICCIGIIMLIILGLILNFIFHLDFWPIVVILIIVFIVGVIALAILNR